MGPKLDKSTFQLLDKEIERLPKYFSDKLREIIARYRIAFDMVGVSERTLAAFCDTLEIIPAADWAVKLRYMPSGSELDGNIMVLEGSQGEEPEYQYYDVDEGRFLSEEEAKDARY